MLFLATAVYVLGYLTWAIYSADEGLGVLPPLEGQYFLAGIVPLALVLIAVATLSVIRPLDESRDRQKAARVGQVVMAVAMAPVVVMWVVRFWFTLPDALDQIVLVVAVVGSYVGMALKIRSGEAGTGWLVWLFRVAVPVFAVAGLWVYATRGFPYLPRELGGPKPFCVELDVNAAAVSPSTLASLKVDSTASSETVRSSPLWLHFDGGGTLVLSQGRGRPVPAPFRLRESTVPVVFPSTGCQG